MTDIAIDNTFDHTGFVTRDIDSTVAFWTGVVGLQAGAVVEREGDWIAAFTGIPGAALKIVHLFGPGVHLEFLQFTRGGRQTDLPAEANANATGHVCLRVDDPEGALERCLAAGGTPVGRIAAITEGPASGLTGVYLRDPNGVLVELLQRPQPAADGREA
ncbi:MAG: VOC family protein [Rhizobiaceae bacterium]|nr:VOC family protein [Rhizobiaceae bacterium]